MELHPQVARLAERYPDLQPCIPEVQRALDALVSCYRTGGKLLVCGNGGSAADCEHIVGELMKGFMSRRGLPSLAAQLAAYGEDGAYMAARLQGALPAISLVSHPALQFAFANDVAPDLVFAQQVLGYGRPGDVLLGISTSGSSRNVVLAMQLARSQGLVTLGLTGASGGRLAGLVDVAMRVPSDSTPAIQERHLPIYHALCLALEETFFP